MIYNLHYFIELEIWIIENSVEEIFYLLIQLI